MKILYILSAFPSHILASGYLRHYHFIRTLSHHHAITLLALAKGQISPHARVEMTLYTERLLTFATTDTDVPLLLKRAGMVSRVGRRAVKAWQTKKAIGDMKRSFLHLVQQESYDLVLFQGKETFPIIEDWNGLPIVIDVCDATSIRLRQGMRYASLTVFPWRLLRYLALRRIEKKLLKKTPHLAFISGRDRDAMLGSDSNAKIIPNGIDLEYWTRTTKNPHPHCIVYTGVMNYQPNVDGAFYLLQDILPLMRQSIPHLEVLIVGRDPTPDLVKMARRYSNVTVTGFVDDMRPYLERAAVYVAPLRIASGMQNKLLEALAMEVPVVTTPSAVAGLYSESSTKIPLLVADGAVQFAACVVRLQQHKEERVRLAASGRRYVKSCFNWSHSVQILEEMCLDAVAQVGTG
jgi:glycosyltransferase involved in cell wall biosynthesis